MTNSIVFKVEKNIPITRKQNGKLRKSKYPFEIMEVGDSFAIPCKEPKSFENARNRANAAIASWCVTNPNMIFTTRIRRDVNELRVWRTN